MAQWTKFPLLEVPGDGIVAVKDATIESQPFLTSHNDTVMFVAKYGNSSRFIADQQDPLYGEDNPAGGTYAVGDNTGFVITPNVKVEIRLSSKFDEDWFLLDESTKELIAADSTYGYEFIATHSPNVPGTSVGTTKERAQTGTASPNFLGEQVKVSLKYVDFDPVDGVIPTITGNLLSIDVYVKQQQSI